MKNEYTIQSDGTIEIKLTQGIVCIIDANDMELIAPYKWCAAYNDFKKSYYVVGRVNGKITRMHRLITGILEPNDFS